MDVRILTTLHQTTMATTEERKKLLEKKFVESRPPLAYAKLSGRLGEDDVFEMLLTHMPVEIGRGPVSSRLSYFVHNHVDLHYG